MISFAFNNADIITMLRQRGTFIRNLQFDQGREIEEKIDVYKKENFIDLNRPVTAFLSFESEEGLNRAKNYAEIVNSDPRYAEWRLFLGQKIVIEEASEPTDIIWENRHFTDWQRMKRTFVVVIVIIILLLLSFMVLFVCSRKALQSRLKYPRVPCEELYTVYNDTILENYGANEWANNVDRDPPEYVGFLQCFCEKKEKELHKLKGTLF